MKTRSLVIIPAYNEVDNLERVVDDLERNCPDAEYVIVNDCSTDDTLALCRRKGYPHLDLFCNLGFSGAVQAGYRYAKENGFDVAVQFDGDGQHSAASISTLVEAVVQGKADYALGSRFVREKKPWSARMLGSRIIAFAIRLRTGRSISDPTSGMRAVNRALIERMAGNLNFIAEPDTLTRALLSGFRVQEYQVEMRDRISGTSHFKSPINTIKYMARIIVSIVFLQGKGW